MNNRKVFDFGGRFYVMGAEKEAEISDLMMSFMNMVLQPAAKSDELFQAARTLFEKFGEFEVSLDELLKLAREYNIEPMSSARDYIFIWGFQIAAQLAKQA